jgi:hypothetical protein
MPGGEKNTYGLPDGEAIRTEMVAIFREQRIALLDWMDTHGYKSVGLPPSWPSWESFKLGAADIAARVRGAIADIWESSAAVDITAPPIPAAIDAQALNLGTEVNATTTGLLDRLLGKVRDLFNRGVISLKDAIARLRKGVVDEIKPMEAWRARRIAVTEASRGYHAALDAAARKSGFVTGWQWLTADGACPLCEMIAEQCQFVPLGQPFAIIGTGEYSDIYYPPAHPNCRCDIVEIVITDEQPDWSETLIDPVPPKASKPVAIGAP